MAILTVESLFRNQELKAEVIRYGIVRKLRRDGLLLSAGDEVHSIPVVLSGVLRVVRQNESGEEVFLYHLYPGQTCAMAINCCQTHSKSMVKAVAEDDSELLMIPVRQISDWMKYEEWKTFISTTYSTRFAELMQVIDLIAFSNMDRQLLHYLSERCKAVNTSTLFITHQEIADEMHTHREAISRLLKTMEQKKLVRLGRNTIELLKSSS
jgi:CRP/FNR family transcriptional regulator, anaerobic regulatory protein